MVFAHPHTATCHMCHGQAQQWITQGTFQKMLLDAGETPNICGWRKHIDDPIMIMTRKAVYSSPDRPMKVWSWPGHARAISTILKLTHIFKEVLAQSPNMVAFFIGYSLNQNFIPGLQPIPGHRIVTFHAWISVWCVPAAHSLLDHRFIKESILRMSC